MGLLGAVFSGAAQGYGVGSGQNTQLGMQMNNNRFDAEMKLLMEERANDRISRTSFRQNTEDQAKVTAATVAHDRDLDKIKATGQATKENKIPDEAALYKNKVIKELQGELKALDSRPFSTELEKQRINAERKRIKDELEMVALGGGEKTSNRIETDPESGTSKSVYEVTGKAPKGSSTNAGIVDYTAFIPKR